MGAEDGNLETNNLKEVNRDNNSSQTICLEAKDGNMKTESSESNQVAAKNDYYMEEPLHQVLSIAPIVSSTETPVHYPSVHTLNESQQLISLIR